MRRYTAEQQKARIAKFLRAYEGEHGRPPSAEQVAHHLGVTTNWARRLLNQKAPEITMDGN